MNSIKLAFIHTCAAFDAFILMNVMRHFLSSGDGINRTNPNAGHTAHTIFIVNNIIQQVLAFPRTALFVDNVLFVLFVEIT